MIPAALLFAQLLAQPQPPLDILDESYSLETKKGVERYEKRSRAPSLRW